MDVTSITVESACIDFSSHSQLISYHCRWLMIVDMLDIISVCVSRVDVTLVFIMVTKTYFV